MEQKSAMISVDAKVTVLAMVIIILVSMACMDFELFKKRIKYAYRIGVYTIKAPFVLYKEFFGNSDEYEKNLKKYNVDKKKHQDA